MENILTLFVNDPLGKGAHIRRTEWTGKNLLLKKAAESCGTGGWSPAANHASKMASGTLRSSKQCRFRWQKHLHLLSLKDAWSEREEAELLLAYRRFRSNWPAISNALGGKSVSSIKNRLYLIFKKVKNKIKKRNYSLSSKSEILKMHYVLFVMKDYLARATGPEFLVQVASKDFICKLLKQITPEVLDTYITIFQEKAARTDNNGIRTSNTRENCVISNKLKEARIEIPEETVEEEAQLDYTTSEPPPMESLAKHKELFSCEATVLELPDDVHRYSRHISSADLTTAAEAPCFQTEPDNFGFSEFAERAWQAISPKGLPNTLSNMGEDKMHETGNAAV